jgi:LacI family transcriptional regulator
MPEAKEVTIYDIAKKLKISAASVSRGLKDDPSISKKTKKKILETAEALGYRTNHFARSLRSQKTMTIGVIVPRLNSHFMSSVIAGIEQVANKEGYNLLISQSSEFAQKESANVKTMFNSRVDGLLVSLAYDTKELSHFEAFFKKKVPVIFFDRVMEHAHSTSIIIDNRKAAYEATRHLLEQGCKRVVHITAPLQQNVYTDRFNGYKQALFDGKVPFREEDLIIGNLSLEAGAAAAEQIVKLTPMPDGIFVANDNCAVGCMLALKQKGIRIPDDIAVVGFNNDPVSVVIEPNLSTVNYPGDEIGKAAARHLINRLNESIPHQNTETIVLRSEFIARASSQKRSNTNE